MLFESIEKTAKVYYQKEGPTIWKQKLDNASYHKFLSFFMFLFLTLLARFSVAHTWVPLNLHLPIIYIKINQILFHYSI